MKNETLLFVCNAVSLYISICIYIYSKKFHADYSKFIFQDTLHIYRIVDRDCVHLNDLILSDGQRVVEIAVWEYENSIMLVLIKLNTDGTYPIELWQLTFHDEQSGKLTNGYYRL